MARKQGNPTRPDALVVASKAERQKTVAMSPGSVLAAADSPTMSRSRFCTHCQSQKEATGGMWIIFAGGIKRRWLCQGCAAKHQPQ
ncbi:MAG: hypothetical protein EBV01_15125 [Betaproteobacteria bacterium]|nr:hypothetical protein [Betaproteobacteria bacterium]NBQ79857.1 hypothetical protein [Betaproteobacteria bacterium]NDE54382.1 hypothetical protein [Actinomycetota bacterium]